MSSSEEDYGRTERPLHKPSHSAHSHGKSKYSETSGRFPEAAGTSSRFPESGGGRVPFPESAGSSSRYNDNTGSQRFPNSCENSRYSASENGNGSPRYNETSANSTRFPETTDPLPRFPAENQTSSRSSRYNETNANSFHENSTKGSRYSESRISSDGDRHQNENNRYSENGNRYSDRERSSSSERYLMPPPSPASSVERYATNDHYINNERPERFSVERSDRYGIGTPERLDRNSERSNERYSSTESRSERSERHSERSEKQSERLPERFVSGNERYIIHNIQDSNGDRGSDRYSTIERNSERYGTGERNSERFSERYLQSSDRTPNSDKFVDSSEGFRSNDRSDGYRSERFVQSPSLEVHRFDRYCTLPSHSERYSRENAERFESSRYLPPPAPAPSDRYHPPERYIPPPAPSNDRFTETIRERFSETPSRERYQDRYIPPPAPERFIPNSFDRFHSSTVNPGDPYMRRDLGYHHHYRLPHPNYHIHHQSNFYHPHYQRTLPHRTLVSYHPHHSVLPSPTRAHLRCCPSPSHYVQADDIASNSSSSSTNTSGNVLTANLTGQNLPVLAASLTNGQNLTSFSASVNVNIVAAQGTNTLPRERDRDRDYLPPCPSPLLTNRGRTPPAGNSTRTPSSNVEYIGTSGGRHVSTPTPPPSLPRCSSMSSCEVSGENTVCKTDHSHHHYPPARRSCSGVLEPGSSLSLCCNSSRRNVNSPALNISNAISVSQQATVVNHSPGTASDNVATVASSSATLSSSAVLDNGRQAVAVSCVVSAASNPHNYSTIWRPGSVQPVQQQSSADSSRSSAQTPGTDSTPISAQSSSSASSSHSASYCASQPCSQLSDVRRNSGSSHVSSPTRSDQHRRRPITMDQSTSTSGEPGSGSNLPRSEGHPRSLYAQAKSYMRRETVSFFGVNENIEISQQEKWIERRKRLAIRKYGSLKDDALPRTYSESHPGAYQQTRESYGSRPDVLPDERDESDAAPGWFELPVRRKPSVAQMAFSGIAYLVTTLTRHRPRTPQRSRQWSRSYAPSDVPLNSQAPRQTSSLAANEIFFDGPGTATSSGQRQQEEVDSGAGGDFSASEQPVITHPTREAQIPQIRGGQRTQSWRRGRDSPGTAGPEVGSSRIDSNFLGRAFDNSNRRQYGMGIVGRFFGRKMRKSVADQVPVKEQLDDLDDYRPFFTYWVTTVQVVILIMSLFSYGFGPAGIDLSRRSGLVLVTSLSLQQVDYLEPANFWLGPRAADLIHLGAKYSPCMRRDARIIKEMEKWREKERDTACCIRNDDSGCVQSSQADCSKTISTWKKWSAGDAGPGGRISGSVCGLDPKFCEAPASIAPHEWPDDITKWPICRKTITIPQRYRQKDRSGKVALAEHMACEVIGHPCCIGIHGTCSITTREYCDFVKGHFHEEASLCSQVSCLDDVCGMISFYVPDHPDQFYRLWTSLFLHAGIVHMAVTLLIQLSLMRDLEKLTGPLRIGIIYIGSGVAGNLASAIFVPYRAEVGPAGSQFGLLACLVVEVLNVWPMLQRPENALMKLLGIVLVLFLFGLLPWIDNYAHFFGFVFGFLLSYAFLPFVSFGPYDRAKKITLIWICLLSAGIIFGVLVVLFYIVPVYECQICNYFNCVPLTKDFCAEQNINFIKNPSIGDV